MPNKQTHVPIRKILILGMILSVNNISIYMIFSFLPFMVIHFYPKMDIRDIGNRAGFLGSAFSVGGMIGNFLWGFVADRYGRKIALLFGLIGTCISVVAFGMAPSYELAVFARFSWGLLNGNVGVSKTYLAEILDDSNNLRGTSYYGMIGGVGRLIGPIIGGYLSDPVHSGLLASNNVFFVNHPFLLPCLFILAYSLLVLFFAYIMLPETRPTNCAASLKDLAFNQNEFTLLDEDECDDVEAPNDRQESSVERKVHFKSVESIQATGKDTSPAFASLIYRNPSRLVANNPPSSSSWTQVIQILSQTDVRNTICIYALVSWMVVSVAEIFPLWVVTSSANGGFDFTANDLGFAAMCAGPFIIISQSIIYPRLAEARGALETLRISLFAYGIATLLFPSVAFFPGSSTYPILRRAYVIGLLVTVNTLSQWAFVTIFALINNTASSAELSIVNAFGQTSASFGRALGPLMSATFFAWTERNGYDWPFNYSLSWYIICFASLTVIKLSRMLSPGIEKRKKTSNQSSKQNIPFIEQKVSLLRSSQLLDDEYTGDKTPRA